MTLAIRDGNGVGANLATTPDGSGNHVPQQIINELPNDFTNDTTAIKNFLSTIAGAITGSRMQVDLASAVNAYLNTLAGAVSAGRVAVDLTSAVTGYLSTLAGSVSAGRVAVDLTSAVTGYLSTLAGSGSAGRVAVDLTSTVSGYLQTLANSVTSNRVAVNVDTTTTGKLDTLHTDVGPASTIYSGNKNVTTAGTAVPLAASQALTKGVRVRAKDANTGPIYIGGSGVTNGSDRLTPSESTWIDINNLATVYIDAQVSGEGVTYSGW